jgi:maltooligosyltrehalose trehalohydrolase
MNDRKNQQRLPIGAELVQPEGVHFRVWAPRRRRVEVVLEQEGGFTSEGPQATVELTRETDGYFSGLAAGARAGSIYRYRLDGGSELYPDPASRFQPEGPHGASQVIDPRHFRWTDAGWRGVHLQGQVIYEMHVGTFTGAGTWEAAARELPELASLGISVVEVMPVAEFPGRFGWGYDGVNLFAPTHLYGNPDDFRRFVDRAHAAGLGVILDVVYNHLGPDGNYLKQFAEDYFTDRYANEWGEAINFDGPNSGPVREFFATNAAYWIDEFHLDGLRLDATQQIFDQSPNHILTQIGCRVRESARGRDTLVVAENELQHSKVVRPAPQGGYGLDAVWNDDFHHSALVALTGRNEAYYGDFLGNPQEFISAVKWGYLYQGQRGSWKKVCRGTPALDFPPARFVTYIENHDQVAHSGRGLRCRQLTSPGRHRAMTALFLLAPGTPMLFQGQEFGATSPFFFFADHKPELAGLVRDGRAKFLSRFRSLAAPEMQIRLPDPGDRQTFERCKLNLAEREQHAEVYALHRELLRLRREDPAFRAQQPRGVDGAVLGLQAFVLRYFVQNGSDRLLIVNFGRDLSLNPNPEPLLAAPEGRAWTVLWSSEDPRYGGAGTPPVDTDEFWQIPGESAVVLYAQ